MLELCEIYVKPYAAFNLIDVALERHSGSAARGQPRTYTILHHIYTSTYSYTL